MKKGDLVITKQCVWYYGSKAKEKRIGIILDVFGTPALGVLVECWFQNIGYLQLNAEGIELLEVQ